MAKKTKLGGEKKKAPTYKVVAYVNDDTLKGDGNDLYKVLLKLGFPTFIKTETNLVVTKGKKTVQRDIKVVDARRCFSGNETTALELLAIGLDKQLA